MITGIARIFQQGAKARDRSDRTGEGCGRGVSPFPRYTLKNKRVNQHLKGPRSDSVFIVLHLPYYPAGANSLKC